ncbi:MAG: hypothetical protein PIR53_19500 [Nocardioides alkalitolerans]
MPEQETRPDPEPEWQRKRRLAAIFGDALPEQTGDDTDRGEPGDARGGEAASDAWLRAQVPPHHG